MKAKILHLEKVKHVENNSMLPKWQRVTLLIVLAYEALGCLIGGTLLVASPNGKYMDMPVEIMHGAYPDFFLPGIILFGLGVLKFYAFISLLKKTLLDWFMVGLALGGLIIWFVVEIIILQELHWLHAMWGLPVLLGWVFAIPLIVLRNNSDSMRRALLICGIISTVWYVVINIYVPNQYEGYNILSYTVSELSAVGSPTRIIWVLLVVFYILLLLAFGWGVLKTAGQNRNLRITGSLIIAYCILNFYWPPMHQREVIAAGGGTISDTLHIVWAMITLIFNITLMAFGAAALNKSFKIYTYSSWLVFIIFGVLTFLDSPGMEANLPTPYIGLWERINMGVFLLWIVVFAFNLLKLRKSSEG